MKVYTLILLTIVATVQVSRADIPLKEAQRECMALNIYHEARGESQLGWLSVAFVTLNRVESSRYPDTVCSVVYQPYQFSWTIDALPDSVDWTDKQEVETWREVKVFVGGFVNSHSHIEDPTKGATHYHSKEVSPKWAKNWPVSRVVGQHIFYSGR